MSKQSAYRLNRHTGLNKSTPERPSQIMRVNVFQTSEPAHRSKSLFDAGDPLLVPVAKYPWRGRAQRRPKPRPCNDDFARSLVQRNASHLSVLLVVGAQVD
jgi:hypothetical protein